MARSFLLGRKKSLQPFIFLSVPARTVCKGFWGCLLGRFMLITRGSAARRNCRHFAEFSISHFKSSSRTFSGSPLGPPGRRKFPGPLMPVDKQGWGGHRIGVWGPPWTDAPWPPQLVWVSQ